MSLDTESNKIKKSILMRYHLNIFEAASNQLIIYKTYRGNNKRFKALMTMDELIDFCTYDITTFERAYQRNEDNKDRIIPIPKMLVDAFKNIFYGNGKGWMELSRSELAPGMIYLSPSTTGMNPIDDLVKIRKAVPFYQVWGDRPLPYQVEAGFAYGVQAEASNGYRYTEKVPMVDPSSPDYEGVMTFTIPYGVFTEWFDRGWRAIAPICTVIEKTIAKDLEDRGIVPQGEQEGDNNSEDMDDTTGADD